MKLKRLIGPFVAVIIGSSFLPEGFKYGLVRVAIFIVGYIDGRLEGE